MAQEQRNISITAPGFGGLNTQDSPVAMDIAYASIADNCVIDKAGRIASRKGFQILTSNSEILNNNPVVTIAEFIQETGTKWLFACGDNQIFIQNMDGTLEALGLPLDYTITDDDWKIIPFNDKCFFFQGSHAPLVFDPAESLVLLRETTEAPLAGVAGYPNCGCAAFGRVWAADFDGDRMIVGWSQLLTGDLWAAGDSGSLDLNEVWPTGQDEVVAITAHNNFLIIFGKHSIVVYSVPDNDAAAMVLTDTVSGIGCVARDSIQHTGDQVLFCDATGIRDFARTVQEKSLPIGDVSLNVRTDLKALVKSSDKTTIKSMFNPEDSFYAIFFEDYRTTYIFDVRQVDEKGVMRATRWPNIDIFDGYRTIGGVSYFCGENGVYEYTGANDIGRDEDNSYELFHAPVAMKYYTQPQDFGSPEKLKFPKQLDITLIGPSDLELFIYWAYDFSDNFKQTSLKLPGGNPYYYNVDEYEAAYYGGAQTLLTSPRVNMWSSGRNVKLGFEGDVHDNRLSIQQLNLQALMGRTL